MYFFPQNNFIVCHEEEPTPKMYKTSMIHNDVVITKITKKRYQVFQSLVGLMFHMLTKYCTKKRIITISIVSATLLNVVGLWCCSPNSLCFLATCSTICCIRASFSPCSSIWFSTSFITSIILNNDTLLVMHYRKLLCSNLCALFTSNLRSNAIVLLCNNNEFIEVYLAVERLRFPNDWLESVCASADELPESWAGSVKGILLDNCLFEDLSTDKEERDSACNNGICNGYYSHIVNINSVNVRVEIQDNK